MLPVLKLYRINKHPEHYDFSKSPTHKRTSRFSTLVAIVPALQNKYNLEHIYTQPTLFAITALPDSVEHIPPKGMKQLEVWLLISILRNLDEKDWERK